VASVRCDSFSVRRRWIPCNRARSPAARLAWFRNGGEFAAVLAAQTHSRRGAIDYERRVAVLAAEKDVGIDCFLRSDRVALCMTNEVAVVLCRTVSGEHRPLACSSRQLAAKQVLPLCPGVNMGIRPAGRMLQAGSLCSSEFAARRIGSPAPV